MPRWLAIALVFASIPAATFLVLWAADASEGRVGSSFKRAYQQWKSWLFSLGLIAGASFLLFLLSLADG